jgi:outer membrane murein-binding lipoprotein Lpp
MMKSLMGKIGSRVSSKSKQPGSLFVKHQNRRGKADVSSSTAAHADKDLREVYNLRFNDFGKRFDDFGKRFDDFSSRLVHSDGMMLVLFGVFAASIYQINGAIDRQSAKIDKQSQDLNAKIDKQSQDLSAKMDKVLEKLETLESSSKGK